MRFNIKQAWKLLILARFISVLVPQFGYIHPDEFFQGPEVVAGDIFNFSVRSSWEFNTTSPIRSVIATYPAPGLAYILLRAICDFFPGVTLTSYLLLVTPRLVMTLASLIHDWSLYRLCISNGKDPYATLTVFSSSYVCLVFYTRTFSNSMEAVLFSVLLCIVGCDLEVTPAPKQRHKKKKSVTFLESDSLDLRTKQLQKTKKTVVSSESDSSDTGTKQREKDNLDTGIKQLQETKKSVLSVESDSSDIGTKQRQKTKKSVVSIESDSSDTGTKQREKENSVSAVEKDTSDTGTEQLRKAKKSIVSVESDSSDTKIKQHQKENFISVVEYNSSDYSKIIGIVITCGFFIRPTFLLFAFCPLLFWFISKLQSNYQRFKLFSLINNLALSSLPTAFILITLDTLYYRGISLLDIVQSYDISKVLENAVVTPLNFLRYNLQAANLKTHGVHPRFLHLVVNIPLLYGILGVSGIFFYLKMLSGCITKKQWLSYDYSKLMLTASWIFPVLILSIFPHQEPRFLIPVLLPLVLLHAEFIFKYTPLIVCWFATNVLLLLFFGFVHQGGLIPCLLHLSKSTVHPPSAEVDARINVVFYHTYMPPLHLLQIQKNQRTIVHDLRGQEMYALTITLNHLTPSNSRDVFLVSPSSVERLIKTATKEKFKLQLLESFSPHFTGEDLPKNLTFSTIAELKKQFSLHLYHVHLAES